MDDAVTSYLLRPRPNDLLEDDMHPWPAWLTGLHGVSKFGVDWRVGRSPPLTAV